MAQIYKKASWKIELELELEQQQNYSNILEWMEQLEQLEQFENYSNILERKRREFVAELEQRIASLELEQRRELEQRKPWFERNPFFSKPSFAFNNIAEQLEQNYSNILEWKRIPKHLTKEIENPQNKKQDFSRNLSERLKQTSQLNQEKNNPQEQLAQSEVDIQELKFQQGQYKSHQLTQSQINKKKIEDENISHFQVSQNEIEEMILTRQNQLEQNYQDLRFNSTAQIREFAEKENTLQSLITCLQNEKQALIEQKEQLENQLNQFRINYEQIEQEKIELHDMVKGLSQNQKLTIKLKAKLEKKIVQLEEKIVQLEQKLIIEEQIKMQLTQALQIKEDKVNELEKNLVTLDQERIKQLKVKEKELSKVKGELIDKLTSGENTKEVHKEKEAKQREINELQQELSRTSVSYNANRKKQVLKQVNNFLKTKEAFLTLREEAIKKLQNCYNRLVNSIDITRSMKTTELTDKYTKEFQNTLVKYNDGLLELNKNHYSLKNVVQENKELEVSLKIENILRLNSFNLDKYKIFKFATNSQEGTRIQLNSNMMEEDINSLRKNLNELKLELNQEKSELKNLAAV